MATLPPDLLVIAVEYTGWPRVLAVLCPTLGLAGRVKGAPPQTEIDTALDDLADGGDAATMERLIEKSGPGRGTVDTVKACQLRVYSRAASRGAFEVVRRFLNNAVSGATVHAIMTAAALGGHLEIVKLALRRGGSFSDEVLGVAAANGHLAVLRFAAERGVACSIGAVEAAAANNRVEVLQTLLGGASTKEAKSMLGAPAAGRTSANGALLNAARRGHLEAARCAIDCGADDFDGAMAAAAQSDQTAIAKLICDRGALTPHGAQRALELAAGRDNSELVGYAIENGAADVNAALYAAAERGHWRVASALAWWHGATDLDEAMRLGAEGGHLEVVKHMQGNGATDLVSAWQAAAARGHLNVAEFLEPQLTIAEALEMDAGAPGVPPTWAEARAKQRVWREEDW